MRETKSRALPVMVASVFKRSRVSAPTVKARHRQHVAFTGEDAAQLGAVGLCAALPFRERPSRSAARNCFTCA